MVPIYFTIDGPKQKNKKAKTILFYLSEKLMHGLELRSNLIYFTQHNSHQLYQRNWIPRKFFFKLRYYTLIGTWSEITLRYGVNKNKQNLRYHNSNV